MLNLNRWRVLLPGLVGFILVCSTPLLAQTAPETTGTTAATSQVNLLQAIVLGMVQGLTEFIPISSTAHLKVIPVVLGWGDPGVSFTAVIQLGSIAAVLWYFWSDLVQVTKGSIKAIAQRDYTSPDFQIAAGIGLGTIPILIGGILIKVFIPDFDNSPLRSLGAIATTSIVMSLLLGLAERLGKRQKGYGALGIRDGVLMGCAQALALVPGVSRSGSTLTAGLFMGLERAAAARFSFLLGLPAITLAGLVEMKSALSEGLAGAGIVPLIAGVVSAAIFSYLSIVWLLAFLKTKGTWIFVWYRLVFGVAIFVGLATRWLSN